jgi:hypothetical protein
MSDLPLPPTLQREPGAPEVPPHPRGWSDTVSAPAFFEGLRASVSVGDLVAAVEFGLLIAATGLLTGLIWAAVAPHGVAKMTVIGAVRTLPYGEAAFGGEAMFGLVGVGAGLIVGVGVHLVGPARRHRGPLMLLGVALGSLGAAWIASKAGGSIGLIEYHRLLHDAAQGQLFRMPVKLTAYGLLLVQPLVATAAYTLLAAWSPDPQLGSVSSVTSEPATPPAGPESPAAGTASSPHV